MMIMGNEINSFETELNSLDYKVRKNALSEITDLLRTGKVHCSEPTDAHNLHCHTFYSYNGYGFSPSYIAWLGCRHGWFASGIVDFDVLDGVDEFLSASKKLNVRGVCGIETRAFIKELADREINSPGEPGVAYHMGVGFASANAAGDAAAFLTDLRAKAAGRTRQIVELVNSYLTPVILDFDKDAVTLTPNGNVTERHVCLAYRVKAETIFTDAAARTAFWAGKLGLDNADAAKTVDNPVKLEGLIRSKTMKKGGVGYAKPDPASFPTLAEMNKFVKACGALPTIAWLDGASAGEQDVETLLDLHIANGAALLNIIPDRNWNFADPEVKKKKVLELNRIIAAAAKRGLPVIAGTEMNAPGLKLVDSFECDALAPHLEAFVEGAAIAFAHTLLQPEGKGYLSDWSKRFKDVAAKNTFYANFGRKARWNNLEAIKSELI